MSEANEHSNRPEYVIVHESDSEWGTVEIIDSWHRKRGFRCIGYHYVITNGYPTYEKFTSNSPVERDDGRLCIGRCFGDPDEVDFEVGAHCYGYNTRSIGVCLIGKHGRYSGAQVGTLYDLLEGKSRQYSIPPERILGHCETASGKRQGKTCPELNMVELREIVQNRLAIGTVR